MKEKDAEQDNLGLDLLIPDYVLYFFIVYNFYFSRLEHRTVCPRKTQEFLETLLNVWKSKCT